MHLQLSPLNYAHFYCSRPGGACLATPMMPGVQITALLCVRRLAALTFEGLNVGAFTLSCDQGHRRDDEMRMMTGQLLKLTPITKCFTTVEPVIRRFVQPNVHGRNRHGQDKDVSSKSYKSSATAEMAARCCTSRILAVEWGYLSVTHSFSVTAVISYVISYAVESISMSLTV